ncbi:hypothetical protein [Carboxylicivirga linearis]|uniref:DUF4493 domain-containing protein n=1 Tax=Carboxylicivirga linearis TaxID=1628157 RepID=A0ABS5JQB5_9BACT|nr:hypothetical protein [Carboxylicivirga linearis]MBS2097064.1 hypothetical protein [Carboxylicivirga linearis]
MRVVWTSLLLLGVMASCIGDEFNVDKLSDEMELTSGIALPLARASITVGDILSEETDFVKYYKDEDGNERIMLFQDSDSVSHIGLNDFLKISGQDFNIPVPYSSFQYQQEITQNINIPFNISNAQLSTIGASYDIVFTFSQLNDPITVTIDFQSLTEGTNPLEVELSGNGTVSHSVSQKLQLTNNELPLKVTIRPSNGSTSYSHIGNINVSLENISLTYARGQIDEIAIDIDNGNHQFDFDVFDNLPDGIEFDDPRFKILVNNSTPLEGIFNTNITGKVDNNESLQLNTPNNLFFSSCPENEEYNSDTIVIDKNNSNIKDFLYEVPSEFVYKGDMLLRPDANHTGEIELDEASRIYMGYQVEVPLKIIVNSTMDADTIDLEDFDFIEDLTKAKIEFFSLNGFPFQAGALLHFYNTETMSISETIESNIIAAAIVDENGIVTEKKEHTQAIELTPEQINKLTEADKVIMQLMLRTSNYEQNQPVVLLTDNELSLQVSIKGEVNY